MLAVRNDAVAGRVRQDCDDLLCATLAIACVSCMRSPCLTGGWANDVELLLVDDNSRHARSRPQDWQTDVQVTKAATQ